jgi:hypothetical protein
MAPSDIASATADRPAKLFTFIRRIVSYAA